MSKHFVWTTEAVALLREQWEAGELQHVIGARLGTSAKTVRRGAVKFGLPPRHVYSRKGVFGPEQDELIRSMRASGASAMRIAAEVQASERAVLHRAYQLGAAKIASPAIMHIKARILELWAQGVSSAQIGARLGLTKDSVLGHVHRMRLAARSSPIKPRDGSYVPKPRAPRRPPKPTAPRVFTRVAAVHVLPAPMRSSAPRAMAIAAPARPAPFAPVRTCQYPLWGDYEAPNGQFCGARAASFACDDGSVRYSPYCGEHHAVCYVPLKVRAREAA